MPLYHPKLRKEIDKLPPEILAAVAHAFLERVQRYSDEMINTKWKALQGKKGIDQETLRKLSDWVQYDRFNRIALEEIEDGTLDDWFKTLLK